MVEVSLQHIIGTIALIGLVVSVCLFYSVYTSFVQEDSQEKQLQQISGTVALNAEEMINLVKYAKYSQDYMVKVIDLPTSVGGQPYKVQLVNDSAKGIYIHTYLASQPTVSADSTIPFNSSSIPLKAQTDDVIGNITAGADHTLITCSGTIYGKSSTVIWAILNWSNSSEPDQITLGLGWLNSRQ